MQKSTHAMQSKVSG